jgi:hypothetical protein
MAAKIDPKIAAKAKRAKKIAIGGGILLVLLLAYEGPKTMKALNPPAPKTAASESASASASTTTTTTGASTAAAPAAAPVPVSAALTTPLEPAPKTGQLSVFTTAFKSKDPFKQLIKDETATPAAAPAAASPAAAAKPATPKAPPASLAVVPQPAPAPAATPATAPAASAAPAAKPAPLPFISATLSVNGMKEGVDVKATFPVAAPMFALVKLTAKTATIKVSGGSLASGAATLTLKRGKPLTLVNTADGTRYQLVLVATSTSAAVPPVAATAPATATTPTSTTPATTTAG